MDEIKKQLRFGLPKGSLEEATIQLFKDAGYDISAERRCYRLKIDEEDLDCYLIRAQEIPKYVEKGLLDIGLTGKDMIVENKAKVIELVTLNYIKGRLGTLKWVLAVPQDSKIKSVKDLQGKTISTEIPEITKEYFKKHRVKAKITFSWGASEVKPPIFADAIVDNVETGTTLKAHHLKTIDTIFETSVKLIANKESLKDKWKREKIENLSLLLKGTLMAKEKERVIVMMHVSGEKLKRVLRVIPKIKSPTIKKLLGEDWYDVSFGCDGKETRELIPKLKRMGCQGIIEWPIVKLVP